MGLQLVRSSKQIEEGWKRKLVIDRCYDNNFDLCYYGVAALSQTRNIMNQLFDYCDENGTEIYYTRTDSILIKKTTPR